MKFLRLLTYGVKPSRYPVRFRQRLATWTLQGVLTVFFLVQVGEVVIGEADWITFVAVAYFPIVLIVTYRHHYSLLLRHRADRVAELEAELEVPK